MAGRRRATNRRGARGRGSNDKRGTRPARLSGVQPHHQPETGTRHVQFHSMRRSLGRLEFSIDALGYCFGRPARSEEHTSELQSQSNLVCRLLLEKKKYSQVNSSAATPWRLTASGTGL